MIGPPARLMYVAFQCGASAIPSRSPFRLLSQVEPWYMSSTRPSGSISAEGLLCLQFHWETGTPPMGSATFVLHGPSGERA